MIEILLAIALTVAVLGVVLLWHVVPAFRRASRSIDRALGILPPPPPPPPWPAWQIRREELERQALRPSPYVVLEPGGRIIPPPDFESIKVNDRGELVEIMPSYEDKAETAAWQASTMEPAVDMSGFAMETVGGWRNGKKSYPWGLDGPCPHGGRKAIKRDCEECRRRPMPTLRSPYEAPERR